MGRVEDLVGSSPMDSGWTRFAWPGTVTVTSSTTLAPGDGFARKAPELAIGWGVEEASDPRLLVLYETLTILLGPDPAWLRSPEGVSLVVCLCARCASGSSD
ncbi:MAG: hypothetical protein JWM76_2305 [Pseudonocardiales bacterium]|nr:hypothetical protein [Pseudonocardiales bacterium]